MASDWENLESGEESPPDTEMAARRLGDQVRRIGAAMLVGCFVVLLLGRVFAVLLFPLRDSPGLSLLAFILMIPVCCVGVAGLVLLIVGSVIRRQAKRGRGA